MALAAILATALRMVASNITPEHREAARAAMQRGLDQESAVSLIVNGFAREVLQQLPMEFAVEAQKLLQVSLEGAVG